MSGLRDRFTEVLHDVGVADERLVVVVGDISHGRLGSFREDCPGRYFNIGICEPSMVNVSAGLSKVGLIPVVHTIAPFIVERSFEQLKLDFGYQQLGGNILTVGSAFDYAILGCTHHCNNDFALLKTIPHSQIFYPASFLEFSVLFKAVYDNGQLNYFRLPMHSHSWVFQEQEIKPGIAVQVQQGDSATIIAVGSQLDTALKAQQLLHTQGITVDVFYVHSIRPACWTAIAESLTKTRYGIVIEEHSCYGGVYDDVLRSTYQIPGLKLESLSIPERFIRNYGTYEEHCAALGFTPEHVVTKIQTALQMNQSVQI